MPLGLSDAEFKRLRDLQFEYNIRHMNIVEAMEQAQKCKIEEKCKISL